MPLPLPISDLSKECQSRLRAIVEARGIAVGFIHAFGYAFDSAFWIAVANDADRDRIMADVDLMAELNAVFSDTGYLAAMEREWQQKVNRSELAYLMTPGIAVESQETVDRVYGGNWYYATK